MIKAPQSAVGMLFAGRVGGEDVQEQAFGERPVGRRPETQAAGDLVQIVNVELQPGRADARRVVEGFVRVRREHQDVERGRLPREDARIEEVLLDSQGLGRVILCDRAWVGEIHATEPREADPAVLDVSLPQPGLLQAHHQVSPASEAETLPHLGGYERDREYPGYAGAVRAQRLEPGLELA